MSFYRDRILPYLIHLSMRQEMLLPYRQRVGSAAVGNVIEVGIGSGLNLPFYSERVMRVVGVDPSPRLLSMSRRAATKSPRSVTLLEASAEALPVEDQSVDTVVMTWTLCTIPDTRAALEEMRRVLKPSGRLLFVEHGQAPDAKVRRWQDRLTPMWKRIGGGCHLNRPIGELIAGAGFRVETIETGYMKGPKPMSFTYEGSARPV